MHDQNCPKVIADRGGGTYLLDVGAGQGQIADTRRGTLFPPKNIDALLSRGYWTPTDDVDVADVLALVTPAPSRWPGALPSRFGTDSHEPRGAPVLAMEDATFGQGIAGLSWSAVPD